MKPILESREYANLDGKFCPYCRSKHVVALSPVGIGSDKLGYQHLLCQTCRKKWYDKYQLIGFVPGEDNKI